MATYQEPDSDYLAAILELVPEEARAELRRRILILNERSPSPEPRSWAPSDHQHR